MLLKMVKKDFLKKKIITIVLFIFMSLSALLVASGSNMMVELTSSMNALFAKSDAPHFVQMHAGEIEQEEIDEWSARNQRVEEQQTPEMINIHGTNIYWDTNSSPENTSVMDNYFVTQNESFDLLLNLENEVIQTSEGEIAVPIHYMQQEDLEIGDQMSVENNDFHLEFTIVDFIRDVQMNPSIVSSKRFVINESDFHLLQENIGEVEYLIEFQLTDLSYISEFRTAYESSDLPQQGPNVDYNLFKILNAITDGMVIAVILLVSILLTLIAILCIRFTILAAIEEDYREIGVMKAIGIQQSDIKRIYMFKYVVLTAFASVVGYMASLFLNQLFVSNILLYIGSAPKSLLEHAIPILAVVLMFLVILLYCTLILKRFNHITAVEALQTGTMDKSQKNRKFLALTKNKIVNLNIFLGLRDIIQRFKMYGLLFFVFLVCAFIIIVPTNFLNTIDSPEFSTYLGIERSDIRIDLQQSDNIEEDFNHIITEIENDEEVEKFAPLVTSRFKVINDEGIEENLTVETGDFSVFPLEYLNGGPPLEGREIALSYLNSEELGKEVEDDLQLLVNEEEKEMTVSGIYQDVTNGGRTAKANLPYDPDTVLWYEISVDVKPNIAIDEKTVEYTEAFSPAKVTDLQGYLDQTLGNTIDQLKLVTTLAVIFAIMISILITSLFLKMLVAKDYSQIAIMRSIGFSSKDIRIQYIWRALAVLNLGIIGGTVFANTLGESLVSMLLSFMGATEINFVVDPLQAYVLYPLLLITTVTITALVSIRSIDKTSITEMNAE